MVSAGIYPAVLNGFIVSARGYNSLQFNYGITGVSYVKVEILQNNNAIATLEVEKYLENFRASIQL